MRLCLQMVLVLLGSLRSIHLRRLQLVLSLGVLALVCILELGVLHLCLVWRPLGLLSLLSVNLLVRLLIRQIWLTWLSLLCLLALLSFLGLLGLLSRSMCLLRVLRLHLMSI